MKNYHWEKVTTLEPEGVAFMTSKKVIPQDKSRKINRRACDHKQKNIKLVIRLFRTYSLENLEKYANCAYQNNSIYYFVR